jgi:hypothetical protein
LNGEAAVNGARGEVACPIGGVERRLCLTLGTLAELETAFGADGFARLAGRPEALPAEVYGAVLAALLRGGGETAADAAALAKGPDAREATDAVAAAFRAALT